MNDILEKKTRDILAAAFLDEKAPSPGADGADGLPEVCQDLLFEDGIYVKLSLDKHNRAILFELYIIDLSAVTGSARELVMAAIGQCNSVGAGGRPFCVGVDPRDLVVLMNRVELDDLTPDLLLEEVRYLLEQGRSVRRIISGLTTGAFPYWPSAEGVPERSMQA